MQFGYVSPPTQNKCILFVVASGIGLLVVRAVVEGTPSETVRQHIGISEYIAINIVRWMVLVYIIVYEKEIIPIV